MPGLNALGLAPGGIGPLGLMPLGPGAPGPPGLTNLGLIPGLTTPPLILGPPLGVVVVGLMPLILGGLAPTAATGDADMLGVAGPDTAAAGDVASEVGVDSRGDPWLGGWEITTP